MHHLLYFIDLDSFSTPQAKKLKILGFQEIFNSNNVSKCENSADFESFHTEIWNFTYLWSNLVQILSGFLNKLYPYIGDWLLRPNNSYSKDLSNRLVKSKFLPNLFEDILNRFN